MYDREGGHLRTGAHRAKRTIQQPDRHPAELSCDLTEHGLEVHYNGRPQVDRAEA